MYSTSAKMISKWWNKAWASWESNDCAREIYRNEKQKNTHFRLWKKLVEKYASHESGCRAQCNGNKIDIQTHTHAHRVVHAVNFQTNQNAKQRGLNKVWLPLYGHWLCCKCAHIHNTEWHLCCGETRECMCVCVSKLWEGFVRVTKKYCQLKQSYLNSNSTVNYIALAHLMCVCVCLSLCLRISRAHSLITHCVTHCGSLCLFCLNVHI